MARESVNVGATILQIFQAFGYEDEYYRGQVRADWEEIVGQDVASNVEIIDFVKELLILKTKNSVWKNEMLFRREEIMKLINERYDKTLVLSIKVR